MANLYSCKKRAPKHRWLKSNGELGIGSWKLCLATLISCICSESPPFNRDSLLCFQRTYIVFHCQVCVQCFMNCPTVSYGVRYGENLSNQGKGKIKCLNYCWLQVYCYIATPGGFEYGPKEGKFCSELNRAAVNQKLLSLV